MEKMIEIVGWLSISLTLSYYISPIFSFYKIYLGTNDIKDAPILLISKFYVNSLCWYIYGNIINNEHIKICNLLSIILSLTLFLLYIIFVLKISKKDSFLTFLIIALGTFLIYNGLTVKINNNYLIIKIYFIIFIFI